MKICKTCGMLNRDDSRFCTGCGSTELEAAEQQTPPPIPAPPPPPAGMQPPPPQAGVQPPPQPLPPVRVPKQEFTKYDLLTIFGFVASLVGIFQLALILDPLALVSSILGFAKGRRFRGLAVAGVIIAAIGLLVRLFVTLYENGVIPKWLITGVAN